MSTCNDGNKIMHLDMKSFRDSCLSPHLTFDSNNKGWNNFETYSFPGNPKARSNNIYSAESDPKLKVNHAYTDFSNVYDDLFSLDHPKVMKRGGKNDPTFLLF